MLPPRRIVSFGVVRLNKAVRFLFCDFCRCLLRTRFLVFPIVIRDLVKGFDPVSVRLQVSDCLYRFPTCSVRYKMS